ncbi:class II aldolase/adducin family protein [Marinilabiliaceae bacterium ANBcel2]|nr:class II aldolase/adducin family protein [Marinilabiliaceae bacterium ANBcel2]
MVDNSLKMMHPKDQIIMIIDRIYKKGFTTTSGGNLSVMDENGDMWVTPSGVDKGSLRSSDIMCVKSGGEITGDHKPSMEYPFHKAIYENRPDIRAVVHAHPPALVAFSIVREMPDTNLIPGIKEVCGVPGYAKYHLPGSENLGTSISEQFKAGFYSVIMENHGAVVGGSDLLDAYERFETLEFLCRSIVNSRIIGEPSSLSEKQLLAYKKYRVPSLPEMETVFYPPKEKEIRKEICKFLQRAYHQNLIMSSFGSVSVRWEDDDFLITPGQGARWNITPEDIVQIKRGECEPQKIACKSYLLHQKIYERFPHINCVILARPDNLMAYSISHKTLDVRTIPESWIFLQDMENVPFDSCINGEDIIVSKISKEKPGVIVENDSVLMTGSSLLKAFDRLEVAEFSAKSLIMGTSLGRFEPMNNTQIEELRKAFF